MPTHHPIPIQSPSATLSPTEKTLHPDLDKPVGDLFDQMFGSMRGSMTILGDIVSSDQSLWSCERE